MIKYVFIQNDPFLLPKVLDKYLREFSDTTAGVNIQSVAQGKRTVLQTAWDLYQLYGFNYFQWKVRRYIIKKMLAKVQNDILGLTPYTVSSGKGVRRNVSSGHSSFVELGFENSESAVISQ